MSFRLPLAGSPIRELFDVMDLVPIGQPGGALKLPTMRDAIVQGAALINNSGGAIRAAHYIVLRAGGDVALLRVGPRAHKIVWVFGPAVAVPVVA